MKILKIIVIFCTTYAVVSGAPEPQRSGDRPAPDDRKFLINQREDTGVYRNLPDRPQPYNRDIPVQRPSPDYRMLTDNREPLDDVRPNSWNPINKREPPIRRETPDMKLLQYNSRLQDSRHPSGNLDPLDSRPFNERGSNNWNKKETRGPLDDNGVPVMKPPLNKNIPENRDLLQYKDPINNRNSYYNQPLSNRETNIQNTGTQDRRQSDNRGLPNDPGRFPNNKEPLNHERSKSWDQTGIRQPPDSREPPNYRGLSDNRNPSANRRPPSNTNHELDINKESLTSALIQILKENKEENVKIAKLIQSSMIEPNISSTNLQNPDSDSMDRSLNNQVTTSTFSPSLQVTAVTPVS